MRLRKLPIFQEIHEKSHITHAFRVRWHFWALYTFPRVTPEVAHSTLLTFSKQPQHDKYFKLFESLRAFFWICTHIRARIIY